MCSKNDIYIRCLLDDSALIFLGKATSDCDLQIWISSLGGGKETQVTVELVIGIFSYSAGIEDD